jgi:tetratricopeptide (TPR) repeat protein
MSTRPTPPSHESPTLDTQSPGTPNGGQAIGTIERLYVLWIVSSLMFVLLVVIVTLLGSGRLQRHAERISEQAQAIEQLREELSQMRKELTDLKAAGPIIAPGPHRTPAAVAEPRETAPVVEEERAEPRPLEPVPVTSNDVDALLQRALEPSEGGLYEVADHTAAEEAVEAGALAVGRAAWSGDVWTRLAVLARLLDRDAEAETFATQARAADEFPRAYYEISARKLLGQHRAREAIVFGRLLAAGRPQDPRGPLLLAEAYRLNEDLAAADAVLEDVANVDRLSLVDKLRLGGLFVVLERWDRLDALLTSLGEVSGPALNQLNYLRAVLWIQQGKLPEAVATLANLLAERPDDYELRTWRGVALLRAREFQAARETLAHAEQHPDRPEAWYWLGMLELQTGNVDQAVVYLQKALAASYRFAPASEALGTIALNQGDLAAALQNFTNAIDANPRRASAHFLSAIAHAKASRPGEAAEALRTALRLDPSYLDTARQTEVIRDVFSEEQLEALAASAGSGPEDAPGEPDEARRE